MTVHGRTAKQAYTGSSDWSLIAHVAEQVSIPVFGSGDCVEPEHVIDRLRDGPEGVLVGRGVLRNPWILAQAADLAAGRDARVVTMRDRGQFLLDYIELLMNERVGEAEGFRHTRAGDARGRHGASRRPRPARAGARPRALGREQAARAQRVVLEGIRGRLATSAPRSTTPSRSRTCASSIGEFFFRG